MTAAVVTSIRIPRQVRAVNSHEVVELDNNVGMPNMNLDGEG